MMIMVMIQWWKKRWKESEDKVMFEWQRGRQSERKKDESDEDDENELSPFALNKILHWRGSDEKVMIHIDRKFKSTGNQLINSGSHFKD